MEVMVIGHSRVVNYLEAILKKKTWAHGYLFHGPARVGKETMALLFVRSLLCEKAGGTLGGCGFGGFDQSFDSESLKRSSRGLSSEGLDKLTASNKCEMCRISDLRLTNRFFRLEPGIVAADDHEKELKKTITIGQVRELRRWLSLASEKTRVVLIDRAETLGGDASNALLKILEEPSGTTVFLLISAAPEYILPTILSRVVPIRFGLVADKEMQKISGAAEEIIDLARGRPGVLFSVLGDRELFGEKEKLRKIAETAYGGSIADAFLAAKMLADDRENRDAALEHILTRFRKDFVSLEGVPLADAIRRAKVGFRALTALQATNANQRLATDIMFLNFRRPVFNVKR